ncbi:catalase A, partial [Spiromyces aspiralis]
VTILFSDRGTPDGHRHMNGFSNHSYILVSEDGSYRFAKWHFLTNQGIKNLIDGEAERLAGINPEYATEDLFNAIERGDYPSWDVYIQVIEPEQALKYHFNHLDITKVLRHRDFPLIPVGRMVLNRNPENYFAEVEQAAFSPSHLVPGIAPAPDRMFQSRLFSYPDTLRHRIGGNYHQIPVNRPINSLPNNHQCDGLMVVDGNGGSAPIYEPNSFGGPYQTNNPIHTYVPLNLHGQTGRYAFELTDDDFVQAGDLYRLMDPAAQTRLVNNLVNSIIKARPFIQKRMVGHFKRADPEYGARVERGLHEAGSEI